MLLEEIILLLLPFAFLIIAGFCEAVMDKLQFHYDKSIFNLFLGIGLLGFFSLFTIDFLINLSIGRLLYGISFTIFFKIFDR